MFRSIRSLLGIGGKKQLVRPTSRFFKNVRVNMEALEDQKPVVKFLKPGRDVPATNLEEIFTEVRAEDDYGVNTLEIYYSVNGKSEKKIQVILSVSSNPKPAKRPLNTERQNDLISGLGFRPRLRQASGGRRIS